MRAALVFRPQARVDLLEQFLYLAEEAGTAVAERYIAGVEQTCSRLTQHPHSGPAYQSGATRLSGMRRAPVAGFETYLVFYVPRAGGEIEIVRVLHGARDIEHLLLEPET